MQLINEWSHVHKRSSRTAPRAQQILTCYRSAPFAVAIGGHLRDLSSVSYRKTRTTELCLGGVPVDRLSFVVGIDSVAYSDPFHLRRGFRGILTMPTHRENHHIELPGYRTVQAKFQQLNP